MTNDELYKYVKQGNYRTMEWVKDESDAIWNQLSPVRPRLLYEPNQFFHCYIDPSHACSLWKLLFIINIDTNMEQVGVILDWLYQDIGEVLTQKLQFSNQKLSDVEIKIRHNFKENKSIVAIGKYFYTANLISEFLETAFAD